MPRLNATLTPDEVSRLLDLPPELVEALLGSGRVLCQLRDGKTRIPLDQLETFFREALIRVYRAEAEASLSLNADPAPVAQRVAEPAAVAEPEPPPAEEPSPIAEPAVVPLAAPAATATSAIAEPATSAIAEDEEEEADLRRAARYVPRRQIDGFFNETKFSIVQISSTGLRIRHRGSLLPGEEAKVSFALLNTAHSVVIRARVVWTSIARSEGETFSITGLRVIEHADRLAAAVTLLRDKHELQPERRVRSRRADDAIVLLDGVGDDDIARVVNAAQRFAADPIEAGRWHSRARFAVSDPNVRRVAPHHPREREEVLALWEYLDRQVDIPKITAVVNWLKKTRAVV